MTERLLYLSFRILDAATTGVRGTHTHEHTNTTHVDHAHSRQLAAHAHTTISHHPLSQHAHARPTTDFRATAGSCRYDCRGSVRDECGRFVRFVRAGVVCVTVLSRCSPYYGAVHFKQCRNLTPMFGCICWRSGEGGGDKSRTPRTPRSPRNGSGFSTEILRQSREVSSSARVSAPPTSPSRASASPLSSYCPLYFVH